jgi:hypothetical protein
MDGEWVSSNPRKDQPEKFQRLENASQFFPMPGKPTTMKIKSVSIES